MMMMKVCREKKRSVHHAGFSYHTVVVDDQIRDGDVHHNDVDETKMPKVFVQVLLRLSPWCWCGLVFLDLRKKIAADDGFAIQFLAPHDDQLFSSCDVL